MHQQHQHYQRISSINASAATAHQQHQHIRSNSTLAATVHQQHQHIRSISASAATVHQQHQRLYSLLTENNHGKTYQGKMSPGQNVTQEVRAKRHPVGQGKMSQGNTSQGKTSPRAKRLRAECHPDNKVKRSTSQR